MELAARPTTTTSGCAATRPGGAARTSAAPTTGARTSLKAIDVGNTLRFKVEAKNADGSTFASSVPTAVVVAATKPPPPPPTTSATGCPSGSGSVQVADVGSPARLLVDQQQASPSVVNRGTNRLVVRYHVSACGGRPVQGALVYATAVPFNQLSIPPEQRTGSDGWASLDFRMLAGFPVSPKQGLIAIFTRARKSGREPPRRHLDTPPLLRPGQPARLTPHPIGGRPQGRPPDLDRAPQPERRSENVSVRSRNVGRSSERPSVSALRSRS